MNENTVSGILNPELMDGFKTLYDEFIRSYISSPKGRKHLNTCIKAREEALKNYSYINELDKKGEDITEVVLLKLLPHWGTKHNKEKGAWIHIAPAVTKDLKQWFEGKKWATKNDWPEIARAIYNFVHNCIENPTNLKQECRRFLNNPITKGMQAGFLSPILNALDSEHFILINSKPLLLINSLAGTSYSAHLKDYPKTNSLGLDIVMETGDILAEASEARVHISDLFDAFSHWLKAEKKFWEGSDKPRIDDVETADSKNLSWYKYLQDDDPKTDYWQIAPGENARLWSDLLKNSIAAVGYSKFDFDPSDKSKDELIELYKQHYPERTNRSVKNQITKLLHFLNLKPGDKFVTNKGQRLLLGVGVVKKPYLFRPERDEYKHTVDVEYYRVHDDGIPIPNSLKGKFGKTIIPLSKNDFETMENLFPPGKKKMKSTGHTLNQILCGPPGTGKTYKTVNYSLAIIENVTLDEIQSKESDEGREKLIEQFNTYKREGQIEFITFHQNFAYEDFIQGIRPQIDSSGKSLLFELKDGVFKRIADRALNNFKAYSGHTVDAVQKAPFDKVFKSYFKDFFEGTQETVEIKMKTVSYRITEISEKSIFFVKHSGGTGHTLSINTLADYYEQERCTMESGLRIYYEPLLQELLKHSKALPFESTKEALKNFVIVIDEINRANISRVFGELITLIENDKRFGQINEMRSTLPSGESFSVPPNLFIIGTMNTADKSIALLDIALRRRFDFVKIYPNIDLVINDYKELFDKLNEQIIDHKGPDFQIGHAYFMGNDHQKFDLEGVMNKKVIPLLYEYLMNDGEAVGKVLGAAGINTTKISGMHEFKS